MAEYSHEQNLRLAQKLLEQQGEINRLRAQLADVQQCAERAASAIDRVRKFCDLTIRASCRVQAIDQARDTLAVLDREAPADVAPQQP